MCFFQRDKKLIEKRGLFDAQYYLDSNPDLKILNIDPLEHFVMSGWREGRNPPAQFNTKFYLRTYHESIPEDQNPLVHYIKKGQKSGNAALPDKDQPAQFESFTPVFKKKKLLSRRNLQFGIAYIKSYGLVSFINKVFSKLFQIPFFFGRGKSSPVKMLEESQNAVLLKAKVHDIQPNDIIVSIVIPCKNAGDEFQFLLKMLQAQKGFKHIELVIVDSGSTDQTLEIAHRYNAKVIEIKPENFSHSYARNLGAEHATGDYLLFTVQDALPSSDTWLHELYTVLIDNEVAAVSCAETPKEDADLFYRQICWNHYNFLGVNDSDRIFSLPKTQNHMSLRQNGQLSDLANLISRELFNQYKYRLNYAEDIDLGIRLIKDGHKLAFLGTTRIIHSHNRQPYYFLKRGYVDNQFLSDIFDDFVVPKLAIEDFVPDIAFTYSFLADLSSKINALSYPLKPEHFEIFVQNQFDDYLSKRFPGALPDTSHVCLDEHAQTYLETLITEHGFHMAGKAYNGTLLRAYFGYIEITTGYLKNAYELINPDLAQDILACLYKAFCIVVGAHLAYCYKNKTGREKLNMDAMHQTLMAGV